MPTFRQPTKKKGKFILRRTGLTKVEKRQVTKLAKDAITTVAEKKFMDSNQFENDQFTAGHTNSRVAVLGYSTTEDTDHAGATVVYGTGAINEQLCLRPFNAERADTSLGRYAPDGKYVRPVRCHSRFRVSRKYGVLDNNQIILPQRHPPAPTANPSNGQELIPELVLGLAKNLPIIVRMIRVTPKNVAGTTTEHSPANDLFQDAYGEAIGVANANFQETEMLFYKINSRRYAVLDDKTFTVQNPLTLSYTFNRFNNSNEGNYVPQISNTNSNCEKYININHQLTERKHGKIYYNDIVTTNSEGITSPVTNGDVGMRREYTLFHAIYKGGQDLVGISADQELNPSGELQIDLVNRTTFTDV